jgi:hypothetical protein
MKAYGEVDVQIQIFLTSALVWGEWSASRPGHFILWERGPGTHWIGGWEVPKAGLEDVEKRKFLTLPGLKLRLLGCPARSQSLYRLRYPGSPSYSVCTIMCWTTCYLVINILETPGSKLLPLRVWVPFCLSRAIEATNCINHRTKFW